MLDQRIARVFPRRTNATPTDALSIIGYPTLFPPEVDAVHISCAFTWDLPAVESMAHAWETIAPTQLGGPATGQRSEEFEPGVYLRHGYTITSRGCPNKCSFCYVPKREGALRELAIKPGWNVLDDNILACSRPHIEAVFAMLREQPEPVQFTGGLEARRLKPWHVDLLLGLRLKQAFFAYDSPAGYEPLRRAASMLGEAGLLHQSSHAIRCYVLIGYDGDTHDAADIRCRQVTELGIMPMAMLLKAEDGSTAPGWKQLQREWANPWIVGAKMKQVPANA